MTIMDKLKDKFRGLQRYEDRIDKKYRDMDDTVTRDRYLRSLRREKRIIDEKYEKEKLKKFIKDERAKETRTYMWGVKDDKFKGRFRSKKQPEFKLCDTSKGLCNSAKNRSNFGKKWI
jgi:hypothetical protein